MIEHFTTMARYNRWANRRLYDACAALPTDAYLERRPAFFGSIHGTLNHILVGDLVWLGRIAGPDSGITKLDQILYDDLASLRAAREAEDEKIIALVEGLDEAALGHTLDYQSIHGGRRQTPLHWALTHLFNHQTHHRGQVHDLLSQAAVAPPPLDLIYYLWETA